jgi:hypothetical protein
LAELNGQCRVAWIFAAAHAKRKRPAKRAVCFYFFLPDPKLGCHPAAAPFWLGAAAIIFTFSFFGFFDSRLPFC